MRTTPVPRASTHASASASSGVALASLRLSAEPAAPGATTAWRRFQNSGRKDIRDVDACGNNEAAGTGAGTAVLVHASMNVVELEGRQELRNDEVRET